MFYSLQITYNVSAPVTAIMVDDTGKQYGPYVITPDKATSIARGSRILSIMFEDKAIADGFDAKTNKLYFKQIKYIVKTFYGGKTTSEYWQSQAQASQVPVILKVRLNKKGRKPTGFLYFVFDSGMVKLRQKSRKTNREFDEGDAEYGGYVFGYL